MTLVPKTSAHFSTALANKITSSASSMTIVSGTDKAGNALSGLYGWVVDRGSASEEFMLGTISGSVITITARGLDPGDGKTQVSALQLSHRRGATVEISDYPILAILARLLNADESFPNKLTYATHPTFSNDTELADKKYVDDTAVAGAPDAAVGTKGISKMSTAPALSTNPIAVGDNDPRVPTQGENDGLAANTTPSSTNLFMTQKDFQKAAETYVVSTGSANAYLGTHSPAPAALVAGMTLAFKANFTNTGAATYNPNGLGATAIKKLDGATALVAGDVVSGQIVVLRYDGTNFQMISPVGTQVTPAYSTGLGAWTSAVADSAGHQVLTDCFLVCYNPTATGGSDTTIFSDSSSTPTTQRGAITAQSAVNNVSCMIPIRKNDYYKIVKGGNTSLVAFLIPIS